MTTAAHPRRLLRLLAGALALAALLGAGGCALTRPAPVKSTFLLDPPAPAAAAMTNPATLRVGAFNVAAPYRGKAFVQRTSAQGYEVDFYSEFLVAPAAMIGEATARALDRAGVFARVVPPGALPEGDYVLDGFVSALYTDSRDKARPAAELGILFFVTRADDVGTVPLWSREYLRRAPVAEATPDGYARALSAALGEILAELARDLAPAVPRGR
jgi:hypothetical protein